MKHKTKYSIFIILTIALFVSFLSCTKKTSSTKLKPIIDKYVEFWNTGKFDGIKEILHPDFELRITPKFEPEKGIESFKESVTKWRKAYPDFNIEINEIVYGIDKAAARWTITATNTGEGWFPPTGKHVEVIGISIIHFENRKIKDEWIAGNNGYWLQQLGFKIVPPSSDDK